MFNLSKQYNLAKKQGLAVNPSRFTDFLYGLQRGEGAMNSVEASVSQAFEGVDKADEDDASNLVRETFSSLFEGEPEASIKPSQWASSALEIAKSLPEFEELKAYTEGDADMSSIGVNEILNAIKDQVAEMRMMEAQQNDDDCDEDGEGEGQGDSEGMGAGAGEDSDGQADGQGQMVEGGSGEGQPSDGDCDEAGEGDPNDGQGEGDCDGDVDGTPADPTDGMSEEQINEMRKALRGAMSRAVEEAKELGDSLKGAGSDEGQTEVERVERTKLIEALRRNKRLAKILAQAGRIQAMPSAKPSMSKEDGQVPCGVEMTGDISKMIGSEFSNFADEGLELMMLQRMTQNKLFGLKRKGKKPLGRGPVVFCVDESGSMDGDRNDMARAMIVAMVQSMAKDKRSSTVIGFSRRIRNIHEFNKYGTAKRNGRACSWNDGILDVASVSANGGTSFDPCLRKALDVVGNEKRADLVFLTDGDASVSSSVLRKLELAKKNGMRVITILVGGDESRAIKEISDVIHRVNEITADMGAQVIGSARTMTTP